MRQRLIVSLTAVAAAALLLAAPARADFQTLYDDYRADGVIDGCSYSSSELGSALSGIPADVREYDPGFTDALNAALEQAASGCGTAPQAATKKNLRSAADGSPGPIVPRPVAFHTAGTGRGMPLVVAALIALLAIALAGAALLGAAHYYGWDLRARLAPFGRAEQGAERRLSDWLRSLRDRLGS
jgi:hypothetical protein